MTHFNHDSDSNQDNPLNLPVITLKATTIQLRWAQQRAERVNAKPSTKQTKPPIAFVPEIQMAFAQKYRNN